MPAVLRKILGSSTYFLMCCGSELSHMTTPTYEKGWENVTCILGSHVPGQTPGDNAVEEVSPAVSRLVSRGSPLPCSSHGGPLRSSPRPRSDLPQGLCSCRFICLACPSSNDAAGSLSSGTQLQRRFLRGTFSDRPRATRPASHRTTLSLECSPPHPPRLPPRE